MLLRMMFVAILVVLGTATGSWGDVGSPSPQSHSACVEGKSGETMEVDGVTFEVLTTCSLLPVETLERDKKSSKPSKNEVTPSRPPR